MIRLIFCDMDGTLLDEQGRLPDEFPRMMRLLRERGVRFAPASGRQYFSLRDTFSDYADEFIFLSENGALVTYQGRELYAAAMDAERVQDILAAAGEIQQVCRVFCGKKSAYVKEGECSPEAMQSIHQYYAKTNVCGTFTRVPDQAVKVALFDPSGHAEESIYPLIQERFGADMQVVVSSAYWVDIMEKNIGKGTAVAQLQKRLNLTSDACAAFGDYFNDATMMQAVAHGIAMGNAVPAVKQLAKYETTSNADHGVWKGIQMLIEKGLM